MTEPLNRLTQALSDRYRIVLPGVNEDLGATAPPQSSTLSDTPLTLTLRDWCGDGSVQ